MSYITWLLLILHFTLGLACARHALFYKNDSRAALGWIAICLGYPLIGSICYFIFGINRVEGRARKLHQSSVFNPEQQVFKPSLSCNTQVAKTFSGLNHITQTLTQQPLVNNNTVICLHNGDEAYPKMLEMIEQAEHTLYLTTYIFETNLEGKKFIAALAAAKQRGVTVKVIIDGIGAYYSLPKASTLIRRHNIEVYYFHPPKLLIFSLTFNLRSHRKLLIIDNKIAFTGGMNIGGRHLINKPQTRRPVIDMHFQLTGPVVDQLNSVFMNDWELCSGNQLNPIAHKTLEPGQYLCRAIEDGPNEYVGKISRILLSAVASARKTIWIMTPYFLPSSELTIALQDAALRGVEVNILLPKKNNQPYVHWATQHILPRLHKYNVNLYYQPPPFVHTKLFVVDNYYALIGSANIDTRSLRLNFELGVEVYHEEFAKKLIQHFQQCRKQSERISGEVLYHNNAFKKIRNAFFWLFSPYL